MATGVQTERERRVKATGSVRRSSGPTIAQAASRHLRPLVEDAERSLEKVRDGKGSEKRVHKLRGTLRKLEIMIGALGCGFDPRPVEKLFKAVRRVRKAAGDVRDMDVAMGVVRMVCGAGGEEAVRNGEVVVDVLGRRREKSFKRLEAWSTKESGGLSVAFTEMRGARAGRRSRLPARCAGVLALARESTAMSDAVRAGLGTPELLHELRLNLKEARTILEALGTVIGPGADLLAERARSLSDTLGEINDLATLAEMLAALAVKGGKKQRASAAFVGELARAAHAAGHDAGVKLARREVPQLVHGVRGLIFGEG
jgi:CHAD domain-containing protein